MYDPPPKDKFLAPPLGYFIKEKIKMDMWQGVGDKKNKVKHLVFPFCALSSIVCHALILSLFYFLFFIFFKSKKRGNTFWVTKHKVK